MNKSLVVTSIGRASSHALTLSIVGPVEEHDNSNSLFDRFAWETRRARNCLEFFLQMRETPPRVVVCERDLPDGTWRDVLAAAGSLRCPPPVIVTSRLADDRLWAEVLNLGGYDVLAKPLDAQELTRTLSLAWERWAGHNDRVQRSRAANSVTGDSQICLTA